MRKLVLQVVLVSLVCSAGIQAAGKPSFGVKAGLTFADQTWHYSHELGTVERDTRTGLALGFFVDFDANPAFGIRPEILYVQKGSQLTLPVMTYDGRRDGTRTYKDRADYLSVVITGKFQPPVIPPMKLYLFAGPRIDIKLSTRTDVPSGDVFDPFDFYKNVVPGATFGIGFQREIKPVGGVLVELRYDLDFGDAMKLDASTNNIDIENHAIVLMAGVVF